MVRQFGCNLGPLSIFQKPSPLSPLELPSFRQAITKQLLLLVNKLLFENLKKNNILGDLVKVYNLNLDAFDYLGTVGLLIEC